MNLFTAIAITALTAALVVLPAAFADGVNRSGGSALTISKLVGHPDYILLNRGVIDTRISGHVDTAAADLAAASSGVEPSALPQREGRIIQFGGPVKTTWLERLRETGAEIAGYLPNNSYLIYGSIKALAGVASLHGGLDAGETKPIRWMGRFEPIQKLDTRFTEEVIRGSSDQYIDVDIQLIASEGVEDVIDQIEFETYASNGEPRRFLNFVVVSVTTTADQLLKLAQIQEVLFIQPRFEPVLHDERSSQIVAGNLIEARTEPSGAGYLDWLNSKELTGVSNFVIDFADTGLDRGSTNAEMVHPDFLDSQGLGRVAYILNYTADAHSSDRVAHGTLVASIACGAARTGYVDSSGYLLGLGVDPEARLGASRIFDDRGRLPFRLSFTQVASAAYDAGGRISNNSWGDSSNRYDLVAQEYDSLVRDAQPGVDGNQEMVFVFSTGNFGAASVSSPGTAKNVITVGASENFRPEGSDSCNFDGKGGIGPEGADNALDILRYSSGGPTSDRRAKPDIVAPGTHVYGLVSRAQPLTADKICPGIGLFQPPGQRSYTWSSGTSMAAPHISASVSLVRRFFEARELLEGGGAPSPAMAKAYLLNSAGYMTGELAGDDLPGSFQGWGLADLGTAFDETPRILVDQTVLLRESGEVFEIRGSIADRSRPLRITLAWTDVPGLLAGPALVNDLDLEVSVGGITVYRGNNFAGPFSVSGGLADRLNNVEAVYLLPDSIPEGPEGNFTITVRATGLNGDGLPGNELELDQDFALVVYNVAPVIDEPALPVINDVSYVKKRLTITGSGFTAAAVVEINGKKIDRNFAFDESARSLSIKKKQKKLNLFNGADNEIVVIENGTRSAHFNLRL